MFKKFPKVHPPLPIEIRNIYENHYRLNRDGKTAATFVAKTLEKWLHLRVARDIKTNPRYEISTLELGAGTLNQLQYEPPTLNYDIVEPFAALYENSPMLTRIRNVFPDINKISFTIKYDRITSIATLEHILNLPEVVASCGILLTENGVFRAGIPSEGTILWALSWKLSTGIE